MDESRLFKPLKIGNIEVKHRIGMAGLSRFRADDEHVPTDLMKEYYCQRASVPGTLLITEANMISKESGGLRNVPGLYSPEQIAAWKSIVEAVHVKASFIFAQLYAMGRAAYPEVGEAKDMVLRGPSAIPWNAEAPTPNVMTTAEIKDTVQNFVQAAKNAVEAGFDGVELNGANGYLIDNFIQDVSNQRDDEYGGSIENRSRFAHEIMKAVAHAIGIKRVGLRLSPWSTYQGMRMRDDDTIPQFIDVIKKADSLGISYVHLTESRVAGWYDVEENGRLEFVYSIFKGPILVAGGYTSELARKLVDEQHPDKDIAVMFGRHFTSNPDLVFRIQQNLEFTPYNQQSFIYSKSSKGHTDYTFCKEYLGSLNLLTQLLG
jgi:NADPH2 dehydrogenase